VLASEVSHQGCFGTVPSFASFDRAFVTFDAETEMLRLLFQAHLLA